MQIEILLKKLAKPAQRAIQNAGITTIEQLSSYSEKEISELHGIGKNAISVIRQTLNEHGIIFSIKE